MNVVAGTCDPQEDRIIYRFIPNDLYTFEGMKFVYVSSSKIPDQVQF